jgi:hypothetical protein
VRAIDKSFHGDCRVEAYVLEVAGLEDELAVVRVKREDADELFEMVEDRAR